MQFCNINFNILNKKELFERKENETKCIATVNAQFIVLANTDKRYMDYINSNYATFDGEIPLKEARKYNKDFTNAEKLPGSEIVYDFCEFAKNNKYKMYFLGGYEDSNKGAVAIVKDKYGIEIEGYSPPYEKYPFSDSFKLNCLSRIKAFRPDIIFVGFGAPKQEWFIEENKEFFNSIGVKYIIGSGGTFEFVSGKIKRAPAWVSKIGLESVFRLLNEISIARLKRIAYSFRFYKYIKNKPDWN
jgi:N-acetylglucosaminyldiphosphoundecaprenol N-acetyl-beta-D-mannosaminyltransferase